MLQMYVMTHKFFSLPIQDKCFIPLQVGKSGNENLGYLTDDTGEHISDKNKNYCELTGMYWVWKNVSTQYVGICHYRRFFSDVNGNIYSGQKMNELLSNYDMILAVSIDASQSVIDYYSENHNVKDLMCTRQVIKELFPNYLMAFDFVMNGCCFSPGNMFITKKEIYDKYCEWLFKILFTVEKRIDISEYDNFQKRVFGFLSERLIRVWLMNQSYRIHEEMVVTLEQGK